MEHHHQPQAQSDRHPTSRRRFLKLSAMAAAGAGAARAAGPARGWLAPSSGEAPAGEAPAGWRGNMFPGRIAMIQDDTMGGHLTTIDYLRVEEVVGNGVRLLTGIANIGLAFESLFPGLTASSTFAIKVNCIGPTDTRWEVVRGIVSGLSQMLGGTFDVSHVTIYDRHSLSAHGYTAARFTFNGHTAVLSSSTNAGSYVVYPGYRLSNHIVNANYVINVPVIKSHDVAENAITVALKNHYGSCYPSSLCGNITGMLTVNTDAHIKSKTGLIVTDMLRGTWDGGPGGSPQYWSTFPASTPNMLTFSTDPVTNEYWARSIINTERAAHSLPAKACPWVEQAAAAPYNLGICDPGQMLVVEPTAVDEGGSPETGALFLAPGAPNPFGEQTTLGFHLGSPGPAELAILDSEGRIVRRLASGTFPAGASRLAWDGRDDAGISLGAGVYFARLRSAAGRRSRRLILAR